MRQDGPARPIAIDLFAGAGGMSLGVEQAGFDVVCAVEVDAVHAAVHAFNFPQCAVLCRDVARVSADDVRAAAGIGATPIHLVVGGPPCQGFSTMGRRALDDPRNALVLEFVRLVADLGAERFVFENVKGLTVGPQRAFLREIVAAFDQVGYDVRLPWRILDAAHQGVPQSRERLFLVGARKGLAIAEYPRPATLPADIAAGFFDPPRGPSCAEALDDLPDAEQFEELRSGDAVRPPASSWGAPSAYAARMRCLAPDAWGFGHPRIWDSGVLTSSARTEHSMASRARFSAAPPSSTDATTRLFKLPGDGISNTLRAGTDSARGEFTAPRPVHHRLARLVTVREMARLHGYPDWFRFHATKWHGARQIGNSVPPPLARAVAAQVMRAAGMAPRPGSQALHLGDESLLRLSMGEAAAHWGIAVPIARRTRRETSDAEPPRAAAPA